jgi:hypothetical protein
VGSLIHLGPVVLIVLAAIGLLITIAPLAIWGNTGKAARLLAEQNKLLRELLAAPTRSELEARFAAQRARRGDS